MNTIKKLVFAAVLAGVGLCGFAETAKQPDLKPLADGFGAVDAMLMDYTVRVPERSTQLEACRDDAVSAMRARPEIAPFIADPGGMMLKTLSQFMGNEASEEVDEEMSALRAFFAQQMKAVDFVNAAPSGICRVAASALDRYDYRADSATCMHEAFSAFIESVSGRPVGEIDALCTVGASLMDAIVRQPEARGSIMLAYSNVWESVEGKTDGQAQALGKAGGSLMDATARQPEAHALLLAAYSNVWESIEGKTDGQAQALGKTGGSLMDAIARQPEARGSIMLAYSNVWESVEGKTDGQAIALGTAGGPLMDAIARQPEATGFIMLAYSNVWKSVESKTDGQAQALGKTGGSLMDATARQPEAHANLLAAYSNVWESVEGKTDGQAQALGKTGGSLMDAIARQPEAHAKLLAAYANVWESVEGKPDGRAIALGTAGGPLMDAIARQPEAHAKLLAAYSNVWESVEGKTDGQALALGKTGGAMMDAIARQPEAHAKLLAAYSNVWESVEGKTEGQAIALGTTGGSLMDAIARQPERCLSMLAAYASVWESVEGKPDGQAQALGATGGAMMDAIARQPERCSSMLAEFANVRESVVGRTDAQAIALGTVGSSLMAAIGSQFEINLTLFWPLFADCLTTMEKCPSAAADGIARVASSAISDVARLSEEDCDTLTRQYAVALASIVSIFEGRQGEFVLAQGFQVQQRDGYKYGIWLDGSLNADECWAFLWLPSVAAVEVYDSKTGKTYEQEFYRRVYDLVAGPTPIPVGEHLEQLNEIPSRLGSRYGYETSADGNQFSFWKDGGDTIRALCCCKCRQLAGGTLEVLTVGLVAGLDQSEYGTYDSEIAQPVATSYYRWNQDARRMDGPYLARAMPVTEKTRIFRDGRWYVSLAGPEIKNPTLTVSGEAHLILEDNSGLYLIPGDQELPGLRLLTPKDVSEAVFSSISIYGQQQGTGKLSVEGDADAAGIGTLANEYAVGAINIHGGVITARGGNCGGAAIGAGVGARGLFDGQQDAPCQFEVNIYGGTVDARALDGDYGAAGIGFGFSGINPHFTFSVLGGDVTVYGSLKPAWTPSIGWGQNCSLGFDQNEVDALRFTLGRGMGLWTALDEKTSEDAVRITAADYDKRLVDGEVRPYAHIKPAPVTTVEVTVPELFASYAILTNGVPMEVKNSRQGDKFTLPDAVEIEIVFTADGGYTLDGKQTWTQFIGAQDLEGASEFKVTPPEPKENNNTISRQNFTLVRNPDGTFALQLPPEELSSRYGWFFLADGAPATSPFSNIWARAQQMIELEPVNYLYVNSLWNKQLDELRASGAVYDLAPAQGGEGTCIKLPETTGNLMVFKVHSDGCRIYTVGGARDLQTMTPGGDEVRTSSFDAERVQPLMCMVTGKGTNKLDELGDRRFALTLDLGGATKAENESFFWVAFRSYSKFEGKKETLEEVESRRAEIDHLMSLLIDGPVGDLELRITFAGKANVYEMFAKAEDEFFADTGRIENLADLPAALPDATVALYVFKVRAGAEGDQDAKVVAIGHCENIENDRGRWGNTLVGETVTLPYYAWDAGAGKVVEQPPVEAIVLRGDYAEDIVLHGNQWYAVVGRLDPGSLRVDVGTAHLVLADRAILTVHGGVIVDQDAKLAIYSERDMSRYLGTDFASELCVSGDHHSTMAPEATVFGGELEIHGGNVSCSAWGRATIVNKRTSFYGGHLNVDCNNAGGSVVSSRQVDLWGALFEGYAGSYYAPFTKCNYPLDFFAGEQDGVPCVLNVGCGVYAKLRHENVGRETGYSILGDGLEVRLSEGVYVWSGEGSDELQLTTLPLYRLRPRPQLQFSPSADKLVMQDFTATATYDASCQTNSITLTLPAEELRPGEKWCVIGYDETISRLAFEEDFPELTAAWFISSQFAEMITLDTPLVGEELFARELLDEGLDGLEGCFSAVTDESTVEIPAEKAVDMVLVMRVMDTPDLPLVSLGVGSELQSLADGESKLCTFELLRKQEFSVVSQPNGMFTVAMPEGDVLKPDESWVWVAFRQGYGDNDEQMSRIIAMCGGGLPVGIISAEMFMGGDDEDVLACGVTKEQSFALPFGSAGVMVFKTRPGFSFEYGPCDNLALTVGLASHLNVPGYKDWPRHDEIFPSDADYCKLTVVENDQVAIFITVDGSELGYRPDGVYTIRKGSDVRVEVLLVDDETYELRSPSVIVYDDIQGDAEVGPQNVVVVEKTEALPIDGQGFVVRRGEDGALTVDMSGETPLGPGELWVCMALDAGGCKIPCSAKTAMNSGDFIWREGRALVDEESVGNFTLDEFIVVVGAEHVTVTTDAVIPVPADAEIVMVARAYDGYTGQLGAGRYFALSFGGARFLTALPSGGEVRGERWGEGREVRYSAWDGEKVAHGLVTNAIPLLPTGFDANGVLKVAADGFYVADDDLFGVIPQRVIDIAPGVTMSILIPDGMSMRADRIHVPPTATLNVYGQDNGTGEIRMYGDSEQMLAAILGGAGSEGCGTINVHGGKIMVVNQHYSAGSKTATIGSVDSGGESIASPGTLNLYGGRLLVQTITERMISEEQESSPELVAIGGVSPMAINVRGGKLVVENGRIGDFRNRASGLALGEGCRLEVGELLANATNAMSVEGYEKALASGTAPRCVRVVRPAAITFDAEIAALARDGKVSVGVMVMNEQDEALVSPARSFGEEVVQPAVVWADDGGTYPLECGDLAIITYVVNGAESMRRSDLDLLSNVTGDFAVTKAGLKWYEAEQVQAQNFEAYRCLDGRVRLTAKGALKEGESWLYLAFPEGIAKRQYPQTGLTVEQQFDQQSRYLIDGATAYVGGKVDAGGDLTVARELRPLVNCFQSDAMGIPFLPMDGFHWGVSKETNVFYAPADTEFAMVFKVYDANVGQVASLLERRVMPEKLKELEKAEAAVAAAATSDKVVTGKTLQKEKEDVLVKERSPMEQLVMLIMARYTAVTVGSAVNLQSLPRLPELSPGDIGNPWPLGPDGADEPAAYTNDTDTLVIKGKGPFADPTKKPWMEEGVGPITEIVVKDPETELPDDIFEGLGTPEQPINIDLPDGWPADDLPVPGEPWHGGYVKIEAGCWPLTIGNVKFQQRYPWNGLVDITFDLTGSTNVELGVWAKDGSTTIAASNFVGRTDMMFAVEGKTACAIVWDADKDALPGDLTKLVLEHATITVGTAGGADSGVIVLYNAEAEVPSASAIPTHSQAYNTLVYPYHFEVSKLALEPGDEIVISTRYTPADRLTPRCYVALGECYPWTVVAPDMVPSPCYALFMGANGDFTAGMGEVRIPVTPEIAAKQADNGLGLFWTTTWAVSLATDGSYDALGIVGLKVVKGHVAGSASSTSAAGLIDLAKGTRVAREVERIVIDPKWGAAESAAVRWPRAPEATEYAAATIEPWDTARLPAGQYEFAYTAGSTDYTAAFWLPADNWTVIDHETITGERPVTGEKVLVAGESVIKQGGKLVIEGETEFIWDGGFKVEDGGRIYAPNFDVVIDPETGLVTLEPKAKPTVTGLRFAQRYPWNGLVDVYFTATYAKDPTAKVWVKLAAKLNGEKKSVKTLRVYGDTAHTNTQFQVAQGEVHLIWDTMKDIGLENFGALEITAQAALIRMAEEGSDEPDEEDRMLCFTPVASPKSGEIDTVYFRFERVISQGIPFIVKSDASGSSATGQVAVGDKASPLDIQYSYDRKRWTTYDGEDIEIPVGQKLYLRGNNPNGLSISPDEYVQIVSPRGYFEASGSVMSLIDGTGKETEIPCEYCFYRLFYQCPALMKAPDLTATVLKPYCYAQMFEECMRMEGRMVLPAKDLVEGCYERMFHYCNNLGYIKMLAETCEGSVGKFGETLRKTFTEMLNNGVGKAEGGIFVYSSNADVSKVLMELQELGRLRKWSVISESEEKAK